MNTSQATNSRDDGLLNAAGLLILLLGTATGSAVVMLGLSLFALCMVVLFYRDRLAQGASILLLAAAAIAALLAFAFSVF